MLRVFLLLPALAAAGRFLYKGVGETCNESEGRLWKCVEESACPLTASERQTVDVCSRTGRMRVVCCPPPRSADKHPVLANLTKSERKCQVYAENVFQTFPFPIGRQDGCTIPPKPLVFGGENASLAEFPHMVRLGYGEKQKGRVRIWACGGSLVSEWFILTAAHCLYAGKDKIKVRWANVGDLVVNSVKDKAPNQIIEVVEHYVPPEYDPRRNYHDIALLKLAREVRLSPMVRPGCLNRLPDPGPTFLTVGWGRTGNEIKDRYSAVLQKVELNLVPEEACGKVFNGFHNIPAGVNRSMICAGDIKGKDVCQGDSGGPLMVKLKNPYCSYSLVGIVSFGLEKCAEGKPSVFTRISEYVSWIENIVWSS